MKKNQRGFLTVILIVAIIGILIVIILLINRQISTSENNGQIVKEQAVRQVSNAKRVEINGVFNKLEPTWPFTPIEESYYDACVEGQYNWKVKQDYKAKCNLKVNRFYAFSTDFYNTLIDFETSLISEGQQSSNKPPTKTITNILHEYYNNYHPNSGYPITKTPYIDDYTVSDLPLNSAEIALKNYGSKKLSISCSEKKTKNHIGLVDQQEISYGDLYKEDKSKDADPIANKAWTQGYEFVCVVSINEEYYRIPRK